MPASACSMSLSPWACERNDVRRRPRRQQHAGLTACADEARPGLLVHPGERVAVDHALAVRTRRRRSSRPGRSAAGGRTAPASASTPAWSWAPRSSSRWCTRLVAQHREGGARREDRDRGRRPGSSSPGVASALRAQATAPDARDATAQRAAEHRDVGRDPEHLAGTAAGQAEAGQRLVEDEPGAGRRACASATSRRNSGVGRITPNWRRSGRAPPRRCPPRPPRARCVERLDVTPRHDPDQARDLGRDAGDAAAG